MRAVYAFVKGSATPLGDHYLGLKKPFTHFSSRKSHPTAGGPSSPRYSPACRRI